jgi:glycosidase
MGDESAAKFPPYAAAKRINLDANKDMQSFYRNLTQMRMREPALNSGAIKFRSPGAERYVLAYTRSSTQSVEVLLNFSNRPQLLQLERAGIRPGSYLNLLYGRTLGVGKSLILKPYQCYVLAKSK